MLQHLIPVVDKLTQHPEHFVEDPPSSSSSSSTSTTSSSSSHFLADATKTLYQIAKKAEPKKTKALESLLLDGFDQEQIWEQLQLFNVPTLNYIDRQVTALQKKSSSLPSSSSSSSSSPLGLQVNDDLDDEKEPARKKLKVTPLSDLRFGDNSSSDHEGSEGSEGSEGEEDMGEEENGDAEESGEEEGEEEEEGEGDGENGNVNGEKERFTLDELDDFAEQELEADEELEHLLGRADYDDNDDDMEEDEGSRKKEKKRSNHKQKKMNNNVLESSSDEEEEEGDEEDETGEMEEDDDGMLEANGGEVDDDAEEGDTAPKSRFESEMSEMKNKIKELEDAAVAPKGWTMVGEVSYKERPTNSLLAEDLFFDYAAKPPPVITQERTASLEDIIKQRIAKGSWDDVVRKKDTAVVHKPTVELDSTKNTEGLAKVYEQQYLKTVHGVETEDAMKQQYSEIESLFKEVCQKLDALSHFHFTPKPALAEASIKSNNFALTVEEITPTTAAVTGTTPTLVAPQEVFHAPSAYSLKDKEEMAKTERKAHRRHRKEAAGKKKKEKEASTINHQNGATDSQPSNGKRKADAIKELKKNKNVTLIDSSAPTQKTSSAKFFGKLQNQASENGTNGNNTTSKRTAPSSLSSKAFKL